MFERRHYNAVAGALRHAYRELDCDPAYTDAINCAAGKIADAFEADNPLFKRDHFLRACQPPEWSDEE